MNLARRVLVAAVPVIVLATSVRAADETARKTALDACRTEYDAQRDACGQSGGAARTALKACRDNAKVVYRDCVSRAKEAAKTAP